MNLARPAAGTLWIAVILVVAAAQPALAVLKDCPGVANPGYKVLLDVIKNATASPAPPELAQLTRDRVRNALRNILDELALEPDSSIQLVRCDEREPVDDTEFTSTVLDALNSRDVLLEVWGFTQSTTDAQGRMSHEADLNYVLLPVLREASALGLPRLLSRKHRNEGAADVLALFASARELGAYSVIGVGIKWAELGEYDLAVRHLCLGQGKLAETMLASGSTSPSPLSNHVLQVVKETVRKARLDPDYQGRLKLFDDQRAANPCGLEP